VNEERFVRDRVDRWTELRTLVERAQQAGLRSMAGGEVRRLGALYRAATADLAIARTVGLTRETQAHLNRLCAAAHDLVYARKSRGAVGRARSFLLGGGFAALVRRTAGYHIAAGAAFALGAIAAFLVFRDDPALADRVLGPDLRRGAIRSLSTGSYLDIPGLVRPFFGWGIIANNVNVTIVSFALGALAGGFAILFMVWQGMIAIGGALGVYADVGAAHIILTWAAAHGPLELTAIFIGTGAGMRTGTSLLLPGRRTRLVAFVETARESIALLGGAAVMLVMAGLLEGFVSPAVIPPPAKWAVGAFTVAMMVLYFSRAGRRAVSASAVP
jgi:uncharacterized membrane protein SpoIIM required for sporulation